MAEPQHPTEQTPDTGDRVPNVTTVTNTLSLANPTIALDAAVITQILQQLQAQKVVVTSEPRPRTARWDNFPMLSLAKAAEIDAWFLSFETRMTAAQIPETSWADLFLQCPAVDEALKARVSSVEPLTYRGIRALILKDHGPVDPVNYYRAEMAKFRGGDRSVIRKKLTELLTLHNRVAKDQSREIMHVNDLCYPFCSAFPPATQQTLLKLMAIAFQFPDPFEVLYKQAPDADQSQCTSAYGEVNYISASGTMHSSGQRGSEKRPAPWGERRSPPQQRIRTACIGCGGQCVDRTKCPAWGKTCRRCGVRNHFESACFRRGPPSQRNQPPSANSTPQAPSNATPQQGSAFVAHVEHLPTCPIVVGAEVLKACIDTGATHSLIHETRAAALTTSMSAKPYAGPPIRVADGRMIKPLLRLEGNVSLGPIVTNHSFVVLPSLPVEVLLGIDFLIPNGVVIDLPQRELRFHDWPKSCMPLEPRPTEEALLKSATSQVIPPLSEVVIAVDVGTQKGTWPTAMLIEACPTDTALEPLCVARGVASEPPATLVVSNLSRRHLLIREGVALATLTELNENAIAPLDEARAEDPIKEATINPGLDAVSKGRVRELLTRHANIFASKSRPLGKCRSAIHAIDTQQAHPTRTGLRPLPPAGRETVREEVAKMLEAGVIQPSTSPWASAVVLVQKKDGSVRFCVDYRKLNDLTVKDVFPLPRISDQLESLAGSSYFSTLDAASGYWQIEMAEEDRQKTAFITPEGLYEYLVMPFGLCNAPATYQRAMNAILAGLTWRSCLVYIDDILIYSPNFDQHLLDIEAVFKRLEEADILLKAKKCSFAMTKVEYLGHVISGDGVMPDPRKVERLKAFPTPKSVEEVRTFLGLAGYYRKFIMNFSLKAAPLFDLLHQGVPFAWKGDQDKAMRTIIEDISRDAILAHPRFDLPFVVDVDASDAGLGGVLSQVIDGKERPVAFISRRIQPAERHWHIREKEALAVIWALETFRHFLIGSKFVVRTDHEPNKVLKTATRGRLQRWALRLAEFGTFDIIHRDGTKHANADAFTRVFAESEGLPDSAFAFLAASAQTTSMPSLREIEEAQRKEPEIDDLRSKAESASGPLAVRDSVIGILQPTGEFRPYLPNSLFETVVKVFHTAPTGAHMGAARTASAIRRYFTVKNAEPRTREVLQKCLLCLRRKSPQVNHGQLASKPPLRPWHTVAMDFCGPYVTSRSGHRFVLVLIDHFTKWVELAPLQDQSAETVCNAMQKYVIFRHGCPERLLSDNGPQFRSHLVNAVCGLFDIEKIFSSTYYPQGDGNAERFMRTLNNALAVLAHDDVDSWDEHLQAVAFAYNTTPNAATGVTPFLLNHGKEATLSHSRTLERLWEAHDKSHVDYVSHVRHVIEKAKSQAEDHLLREWEAVYRRFQKRKDVRLIPGQQVLIRLSDYEKQHHEAKGKLSLRWSTPAKVIKELANGKTYVVQRDDQHSETVNVQRLLPVGDSFWDTEVISERRKEEVKAATPKTWHCEDESDDEVDIKVTVEPLQGQDNVLLPGHNETPVDGEHTPGGTDLNRLSNVYEVERIVGERNNDDGTKAYQIRWKGYTSADDSWEPERNINMSTLREWRDRLSRAKMRGRRRNN